MKFSVILVDYNVRNFNSKSVHISSISNNHSHRVCVRLYSCDPWKAKKLVQVSISVSQNSLQTNHQTITFWHIVMSILPPMHIMWMELSTSFQIKNKQDNNFELLKYLNIYFLYL